MQKFASTVSGFLLRSLPILIAVLFISSIYLYVFPSPSLTYIAVVLFHLAFGIVAAILLIARLPSIISIRTVGLQGGWLLITVGAVLGIVLIFTGTARPWWNWMYAHIAFSFAGIAILLARWMGSRGRLAGGKARAVVRYMLLLALAAALGIGGWHVRQGRWLRAYRISNPPPLISMDAEGDGPGGPFFPSSSQTSQKQRIPADYFMESDACRRCHADIYKQWFGSMHHFSSFNNQWYRKSVEYMQEVAGVTPSKWCAGCHDPALLFSGLFDTPIRQIVDRPEARAGMGCMMCHSISQVKSTMGQGDFMLEYPRLHELAASKNSLLRWFHDFVINLNPEPHRRVFLKPFMRTQTAEFCSSCHKVHLDAPVNHYRWIRGFNEYDNWQASGVSGFGARSFYYPPKSQQCSDCHMPAVKSGDKGAIAGFVHSHAFPGANTAVPIANKDADQLKLEEAFLKGSVSVDIFALSPAPSKTSTTSDRLSTELSTTFAVGEEAETSTPKTTGGAALPISAPLDRISPSVRRGDTVLVDVVVRTRKVGHFFPGGTVDAYDTWVELKATDDKDRVLFWSGKAEDEGKGPVEKGAHFYRALLVDGHGNPINKRNAWASRAVVYTRLIPPGAADTVHYRLHIPQDVGGRIKIQARLCYRKFSWYFTHFSFAGVPDAERSDTSTTPDYDDRPFAFTGDTSSVSGNLKVVPDLPIISLSEREITVVVLPASSPPVEPKVTLQPDDWTRWNDYGIGLFLQGDLRGAQQAFEQVTRIDPENPDGWVNLGRVAVQEGDMARARQVLEKALKLKPDLARANYFFARVLRAEGNYEDAAGHLRTVLAQYPRDRVVLNDFGRILFLQRKYTDAVSELQQVLAIDPEDLQAHYNLMLCYQGLGQTEQAQKEQKLYLRFKADESAQVLTGPYRRNHPEDNNERQAIHEHESVPLTASGPPRPARGSGSARGRANVQSRLSVQTAQ